MDHPDEDESVTQSSQSCEMPSLGEPTTMTGKPCLCPIPKSPATKSRNLVICIDGTSNQFGSQVRKLTVGIELDKYDIVMQNTNVIELYSHILKQEDDEQLTYYDSGIGTYATPSWKSWGYIKQVIYNKIDLAIAWWVHRVSVSKALTICNTGISKRLLLARIAGYPTTIVAATRSFCLVSYVSLTNVYGAELALRLFSWSFPGPGTCGHD